MGVKKGSKRGPYKKKKLAAPVKQEVKKIIHKPAVKKEAVNPVKKIVKQMQVPEKPKPVEQEVENFENITEQTFESEIETPEIVEEVQDPAPVETPIEEITQQAPADEAKFDEFVNGNTEEVKEVEEVAEVVADPVAADPVEEEEDEEVYEEVQDEELQAANETESPRAKKSFSEIAAGKSMGFNATMLIAACDWLFPSLIKMVYKYIKKDKRIDKVKFSDIKLTAGQIESLGESSEAMAEYIFQYINPAYLFFIGLAMHYDSNIQRALDKMPEIVEEKKEEVKTEQVTETN